MSYPLNISQPVMATNGSALALERGLPTNLEAEQFVLGSILLEDSLFPLVSQALDAADFSIEKHRRIFLRMGELKERGENIEYLTLVEEIDKHNQLEACDGIAYISSLTDGLPRLSNIESYLKIVKDKSLLRNLIFTAQNIITQCIEGGQEAENAIADAESAVLKIGDANLRSNLANPAQIVGDFAGGREAFLDPAMRLRGISTPFIKFDELTTGLHSSELIIVAARPSMGKTALALNIAQHVATDSPEKTGTPVAVFSLEMSKEVLLTRMLCATARVDSHRFRSGYINKEEKERLQGALNQLVKSRLFIDDSADTTVMDISAKCRRMKAEHGLGLVIVDYLQLMASRGRQENRVQEISGMSRGLKLLAKDLDVPVIALSQLSRAPETRPGSHRPQLSDLRESGSIEQDADVVAFIFREEVYKQDRADLHGVAELIVSKQRNGPIGKIKLAFLHKYVKFENLAEHVGVAEEDIDAPF